MNSWHFIKAAGVVALCIMFVGCSCVKKEELETVRTDLQGGIIDVSKQADDASLKASEAQKTAAEANARSKMTEEALNRAFKKSMRK